MGCARLRRGGRSDHDRAPDNAGARRTPQGARRRHAQPPETVSIHRPVLPLPADGHLLEVRDDAFVRRGVVHAVGAPPPPEIDDEIPEERDPHRGGARVLLDPLLGHSSGGQDRAA